VRESAGTTDTHQAKKILKRQEGKALSDEPVFPRMDRIRYEEAAAAEPRQTDGSAADCVTALEDL
jgi:hypothetical protein